MKSMNIDQFKFHLSGWFIDWCNSVVILGVRLTSTSAQKTERTKCDRTEAIGSCTLRVRSGSGEGCRGVTEFDPEEELREAKSEEKKPVFMGTLETQ